GRLSRLRRGRLYYWPGIQRERWPAVSLSRCTLRCIVLVPHHDGAHAALGWDRLHRKRDAIVGIQGLPVHVQELLWAPGTGEEQGVTGKTRQGIAIASIGCEADPKTLGWQGRSIDVAVCKGRIDRVSLQDTQRHLPLSQRQHGT